MTARMALLAVVLLLAQAVHASIVLPPVPVQYRLRRATAVADAVATDEPNVLKVTAIWKGTPPAAVLRVTPHAACGGTVSYRPGEAFLALFDGENVTVLTASEAAPYLTYLFAPKKVTADEVARMLQAWDRRTIDDAAMAGWLRELLPVAEVDDWLVDEPLSDFSPTLFALDFLDRQFNDPRVSRAELPCMLEVVRELAVAPLLQAFDHPPATREERKTFYGSFRGWDELTYGRCPASP